MADGVLKGLMDVLKGAASSRAINPVLEMRVLAPEAHTLHSLA